MYRRADRVVCVTDDDAAVVRTEIPDADIVVVPNAHAEDDAGPGFDERSRLSLRRQLQPSAQRGRGAVVEPGDRAGAGPEASRRRT